MVLEHKLQESCLAGVEGKITERGAKIPYAAMDLSRGQGEQRDNLDKKKQQAR